MKMAFPIRNLGDSIPMLHTAAIGNISGAKMKLVDLEFPKSYTDQFKGPKFGIRGVRDILGVPERPLVLNMIKPDVGWSPKEGAEMAYQAFSGGVDIIKDDELVPANPDFCPLEDRVKAIMAVAAKAEEETGEKKLYTPNITDSVSRIRDNAYRAREAGANALMLNVYTAGYSAMQMLAEDPNLDIPILAHPDYAAAVFSAPDTGVASYLMMGKLVRLSGADIMIYSTHFGKIPIMRDRYIQTAQALRHRFHDIKDTFPGPGGGMYQGIVRQTVDDLGNDCIVAAGGAIHGHPMGARGGAKAMRRAVDAAVSGVGLGEAARDCEELKVALELWGADDKDLFDMKA
jgi:2,3-diketo-5-methylthiopentyl-1-phosphate enolase